MIFLAPFWHSAIINGGMLALALEAAFFKKWAWLFLPALWFGGYEILAWRSHTEIPAFKEFVAHQNYGPKIEFDQDRQSIVIVHSDIIDGLSRRLLNDYGVTELFYADHYGTTRERLANADTCATMELFHSQDSQRSVRPVYAPKATRASLPGVCWIVTKEEPDRPELRLKSSHEQGQFNSALPYSIDRVQIVSEDGVKSQAAAAKAAPYKWFPTPIFGCGLNSGNASWDCFGGFMKESIAIGPNLIDQTISNLGVINSPLVERVKEVAARQSNEFDYSDDEAAHMNAELDRFILDSTAHLSKHDFNRLRMRTDFYAFQLPGLAKALCRSAEDDDEQRARAVSALIVGIDTVQAMHGLPQETVWEILDNVQRARDISEWQPTDAPLRASKTERGVGSLLWNYVMDVSRKVGGYCGIEHVCGPRPPQTQVLLRGQKPQCSPAPVRRWKINIMETPGHHVLRR